MALPHGQVIWHLFLKTFSYAVPNIIRISINKEERPKSNHLQLKTEITFNFFTYLKPSSGCSKSRLRQLFTAKQKEEEWS